MVLKLWAWWGRGVFLTLLQPLSQIFYQRNHFIWSQQQEVWMTPDTRSLSTSRILAGPWEWAPPPLHPGEVRLTCSNTSAHRSIIHESDAGNDIVAQLKIAWEHISKKYPSGSSSGWLDIIRHARRQQVGTGGSTNALSSCCSHPRLKAQRNRRPDAASPFRGGRFRPGHFPSPPLHVLYLRKSHQTPFYFYHH